MFQSTKIKRICYKQQYILPDQSPRQCWKHILQPSFTEKTNLFITTRILKSHTQKDESRTHNFQKKYFICFNKSPLKMMKMLFIPFQKLSLFSRNSIFFVDFLAIQKKQRLHQKDKGNLKFMMSQLGYQTLHTLRNISPSKGNQTMIYGQVIKYSKENIFLQRSCRK